MARLTGRVRATRPLTARLSIASISSMVDVIVAQHLRSPCLEIEGRPTNWNNGAGAAALTVAATRDADRVSISAGRPHHEGDKDMGFSRTTPANGGLDPAATGTWLAEVMRWGVRPRGGPNR